MNVDPSIKFIEMIIFVGIVGIPIATLIIYIVRKLKEKVNTE